MSIAVAEQKDVARTTSLWLDTARLARRGSLSGSFDGSTRLAQRLAFFLGCEMRLGMKTDRIRTDITDIVFVFVFMSGFGFEYR
jgi:hypothetical protein